MTPVTALPVQPVAPATHTRMAILHAPFSCPSSLLDSTTFSDGRPNPLPSLFSRRSTASGSLALWVDLRLCCKNEETMVTSALFQDHQRSSLHEQSKPVQMASFRSRDHFALCPLVSEVFAQLSRPGRDDAGTG